MGAEQSSLDYDQFYCEVILREIQKAPKGSIVYGVQVDKWPAREEDALEGHMQVYEQWKKKKLENREKGENPWLTFADFIPFVGCAARSINAAVKAAQHDPGAGEEAMNAGLDCATDLIPFGKIVGAGVKGVKAATKIGAVAVREGAGAAAHATVEGAKGLTLDGVKKSGKDLLASPFKRLAKDPVEALVVGTAEQIALAKALEAAALTAQWAHGSHEVRTEWPTDGPEDRKQPTYQHDVTPQSMRNWADKFVAMPEETESEKPDKTEKHEQQTQSAPSTSTSSLPVYIGVVILGGLAVSAIF